jgi:PAS domain S-box-containing protein
VVLKEKNGRINGILSSGEDITLQKEAQRALRESEKRYRQSVEDSPNPIFSVNRDGIIQTWNRASAHIFQFKSEEIVGKSYKKVLWNRDKVSEMERMIEQVFQGRSFNNNDLMYKCKDGSLRFTVCRLYPLRTHGRIVRGCVFANTDVTERKRLEEQLRQAQKMESIGRLAGGIAHDFNNLLTVILGYSDILLMETELDEMQRIYAEEIKRSSQRAASLTQQLLAFSRKQILQPKVFNLNTLFRDLEMMLRRLIGEDINLKTCLSENLGLIKADPGQIEQVIMNIALNARDAMLNGGDLSIETSNIQFNKNHYKSNPEVKFGNYVLLSMKDTGHGMDEETIKHIFEPFFTTKGIGKGTGLGLATVYGIVKQSDGYIYVESERNRGTLFKIYLPCVDESIGKDYLAREKRPEGGHETILLVEDEEDVRKMITSMLRSFGYTVVEAKDGREAMLRSARFKKKPIHLVITDVVMPGMSGIALAKQLLHKRNDMKVLYISGYTDNAEIQSELMEKDMPILKKPFSPKSLAHKVRKVLDKSVES